MKLKKLLAAVAAGAMAISAVAVSSFTASADTSYDIPELAEYDGTGQSTTNILFWSDTLSCDDYDSLTMTYSVDDSCNAKIVRLVINSGESIDNGTTWKEANTTWDNAIVPAGNNLTLTIDFSDGTYTGKAFQYIGCVINRADTSSDSAVAGITIHSIVLKEKTTTDPTDPETPGDDTGDTGDEETPAEPITIWEGTQEMASGWGNSVQIESAFANISSTGKLVCYVTDSNGGQYGLRYVDGDNWININEYADISGDTFEYTVDATLLETLKTHTLVVTGQNYTLTKVEFIPDSASTGDDNTGSTDEPTTPDSGSSGLVGSGGEIANPNDYTSIVYVGYQRSLTLLTSRGSFGSYLLDPGDGLKWVDRDTGEEITPDTAFTKQCYYAIAVAE